MHILFTRDEMLSKRATIGLSIALGVALELGIHWLSGRREAWDSEQYWTIGLPIAVVTCALLGFLSRGTNWIWTLLVVPSQVMTMMIRGGEIGGLWPLTIVLSAILSVPFRMVAFTGSLFRPKPWRA